LALLPWPPLIVLACGATCPLQSAVLLPVPVVFPHPPRIAPSTSVAAFSAPPLTDESVLVAWLPAPPVTAANEFGKPALFVHMPLTETVPAPARFEQPPVTLV